MTRQQAEKMKVYEEKAKELVSLTLNVCEERLTQPVEPTARGCFSFCRHKRSSICEYIYCRVPALCRRKVGIFFCHISQEILVKYGMIFMSFQRINMGGL